MPLQRDCQAGDACYWVADAEGFFCLPAGNVEGNQPCALANDCEPTLVCVPEDNCAGGSETCCRSLCEIDDDCPVGTCLPHESGVIGYCDN